MMIGIGIPSSQSRIGIFISSSIACCGSGADSPVVTMRAVSFFSVQPGVEASHQKRRTGQPLGTMASPALLVGRWQHDLRWRIMIRRVLDHRTSRSSDRRRSV